MAKQIIDKLEDIKMQFDIAAKANLRLLRESDAFGRHCGRSIDLRDDDFKNRVDAEDRPEVLLRESHAVINSDFFVFIGQIQIADQAGLGNDR